MMNMKAERLEKDIRDRICMLHIAPDTSGCDAGLYDTAAADAVREVAGIIGVDIDDVEDLTEELLPAVADIAAAAAAEAVMLGEHCDGAASSRTDGELTVRFAEGTSAFERKIAKAAKMRERGIREAVRRRRLRW